MNFKHCSLLLLAGITYITTAFAQPRIPDQGVIGGNNDDQLTCIYLTDDKGLISGGYSRSPVSDQKTENKRGYDDYWIVKLDATGNIRWDRTIGGNGEDNLGTIQQTSDGGFILGGTSNSAQSGDKTQNSRGGTDYWIIKLDVEGNIKWDKTIGGSNDDLLTSIQQTTVGGYILGGDSFSNKSGEKTQNSRGEADYWIVKVDATGSIQWDKTIGGQVSDYLTDVQQTTDGGYSYSNISGEKTENNRGSYLTNDYWVVKTNSNGIVQWDKTIGGSDNDDLAGLREIKRNDYVLGGSSRSGISGDKTGGNRGTTGRTSDYWLVELRYLKPDSTAITSVQSTNTLQASLSDNKNTFAVYPNPAWDKIIIQSKGNATFILTNVAGKTILTKTIIDTGAMDISHLPAGVYYLSNTTTRAQQKILIGR